MHRDGNRWYLIWNYGVFLAAPYILASTYVSNRYSWIPQFAVFFMSCVPLEIGDISRWEYTRSWNRWFMTVRMDISPVRKGILLSSLARDIIRYARRLPVRKRQTVHNPRLRKLLQVRRQSKELSIAKNRAGCDKCSIYVIRWFYVGIRYIWSYKEKNRCAVCALNDQRCAMGRVCGSLPLKVMMWLDSRHVYNIHSRLFSCASHWRSYEGYTCSLDISPCVVLFLFWKGHSSIASPHCSIASSVVQSRERLRNSFWRSPAWIGSTGMGTDSDADAAWTEWMRFLALGYDGQTRYGLCNCTWCI